MRAWRIVVVVAVLGGVASTGMAAGQDRDTPGVAVPEGIAAVEMQEASYSPADAANGVVVNGTGAYVTGYVGRRLPGLEWAGGRDAFLRKYDASGAEVWTRQFGSSEIDNGEGVATDGSDLFVAGRTTGSLPGQRSSGGGGRVGDAL
jgi:hypothetical protein